MNKKRALSLAREWARGLLRKTNYMAQVMISAAEDYQQKWCDECDLRVENIRWGQVASEQDKAVERLQEENEKLRNSRDRWRKCAEEFSAGGNQRDNETEKLQTENEKLQAELDSVKCERDAAIKDLSEIIGDIEETRCKYGINDADTDKAFADLCGEYCANMGNLCYEEGEHFRCKNFKWRGPHKEE